jgi:hypothetical protein
MLVFSSPEDGRSMSLRNVGFYQIVHAAFQPRRRTWTSSSPWERQISYRIDHSYWIMMFSGESALLNIPLLSNASECEITSCRPLVRGIFSNLPVNWTLTVAEARIIQFLCDILPDIRTYRALLSVEITRVSPVGNIPASWSGEPPPPLPAPLQCPPLSSVLIVPITCPQLVSSKSILNVSSHVHIGPPSDWPHYVSQLQSYVYVLFSPRVLCIA